MRSTRSQRAGRGARWTELAFTCLASLFLFAARARADVRAHEAAVVYGTDDRHEVYQARDERFASLARNAIVAIVQDDRIQSMGEFPVLDGKTYQERSHVCSDQRFADQPALASCSGTLIDVDLVLTAGQCTNAPYGNGRDLRCENQRYVFDYFYDGPGTIHPIGFEDLYSCRRILVRYEDEDDEGYQYAIVQLDRPVPGRVPAALAPDGRLAAGQPITVMGFPSGIPMKLAPGVVLDPGDGETFVGNPDAFAGNTGSGVFDANGRLVGVLAGDGPDFEKRGSCNVVRVEPAEDGNQAMTYVHRAIDALCASGYPSERLCDVPASCGDDECSAGEPTTCPADCQGPFCGDGECDDGESYATCPLDCRPATENCAAATAPRTEWNAGSIAAFFVVLSIAGRARTRRRGRPRSEARDDTR